MIYAAVALTLSALSAPLWIAVAFLFRATLREAASPHKGQEA